MQHIISSTLFLTTVIALLSLVVKTRMRDQYALKTFQGLDCVLGNACLNLAHSIFFRKISSTRSQLGHITDQAIVFVDILDFHFFVTFFLSVDSFLTESVDFLVVVLFTILFKNDDDLSDDAAADSSAADCSSTVSSLPELSIFFAFVGDSGLTLLPLILFMKVFTLLSDCFSATGNSPRAISAADRFGKRKLPCRDNGDDVVDLVTLADFARAAAAELIADGGFGAGVVFVDGAAVDAIPLDFGPAACFTVDTDAGFIAGLFIVDVDTDAGFIAGLFAVEDADVVRGGGAGGVGLSTLA